MNDISDEMAVSYLKAVLAAHDAECQFWEKESVDYSRNQFLKHQGSMPSIESIMEAIGIERAEKIIEDILQYRSFVQALRAKSDPCHYCGSTNDLSSYEFGLMRLESTSRSWGETAATAAISAITLPLVGAGRISLPGNKITGELLRLNLIICKSCMKNNSNFLGLFMPKEKHFVKHPYWDALHEAGFTKFVPKEEYSEDYLWFTRL